MTVVFSFHDRWLVPAAAGLVFAALRDADHYPDWWPNVLVAQRLDEGSGILVCRSLLPYSLRMTVRREVIDPAAGLLRVRLQGDLVGWSSWHVLPIPRSDPQQTLADFRQQVTAPGVPGGNSVALRPILDANHRVMMWRGRRGLIRHLRRSQPIRSEPAASSGATDR